jgi:voltage-gated potassium channel
VALACTETDGGRVLAMALMITGIGFVAILTGAVAERFLESARAVRHEERKLADEVATLRQRIEKLEAE